MAGMAVDLRGEVALGRGTGSGTADLAAVHSISQGGVIECVLLQPAAVRRTLEPEEVAACVLYLCSDLAMGLPRAAYPLGGRPGKAVVAKTDRGPQKSLRDFWGGLDLGWTGP